VTLKRSGAPKRKIPWRTCRSCHRVGVRGRLVPSWDQCNHGLLPVGKCGQCGAKRPLVECHKYDFRPRKPIPRLNATAQQKRRARYRKGLAAYRASFCYKFVNERAANRCEYIIASGTTATGDVTQSWADGTWIKRCPVIRVDGVRLTHHHKTYARFGGKELPEDIIVLCDRHHQEAESKHPTRNRNYREAK
jgi:hypothetical protein